MNERRLLAMAGISLLVVACISSGPAASPTLAPGETPTLAPGQTAVPTLIPGTTSLPPGATPTLPPGATPTVAPPTTPPTSPPTTPPTAPPTAPPTEPPPPTYGTAQAAAHVGEFATVCGHVNGANFVADSVGIPTFLNLDSAWPFQTFNVVIWGEQRADFDNPPEERFFDKDVCVTGVIQQYDTWLQIQAGRPQIRLQH